MKHTVYTSSVIDAPIDAVWAIARDFNALPAWHPAVIESFIEGDQPGDRVGCIRNFKLTTGDSVREQLVTLSDINRQCSYLLLDGPLPVRDYVATLRLTPVTDGNRTFVDWHAGYFCDASEERTTKSQLTEIFQDGFDALKRHFAH